MALHALELLPDPATRAWAEADWEALRAAALPSQADHQGATNQPHVTVVSAPRLSAHALEVAAEAFGPLLPASARMGGILALGQERLVLARHIELDDAILAAYLQVRAALGDWPRQRLGWTPHLTLAARMPAEQLPAALAVLSSGREREITLDVLRHWDPGERRVRRVTPAAASAASAGPVSSHGAPQDHA